ncbi:hypothetical protein NZOSNM25_002040 [Nitrosopumilus zosterae]|nr:hypothetical protein [Nitrosopumilus zosterae]BDQ31898.1 hypothetical protein NZOSNM25_002040 [Nitrosopumilus zosterae]
MAASTLSERESVSEIVLIILMDKETESEIERDSSKIIFVRGVFVAIASDVFNVSERSTSCVIAAKISSEMLNVSVKVLEALIPITKSSEIPSVSESNGCFTIGEPYNLFIFVSKKSAYNKFSL